MKRFFLLAALVALLTVAVVPAASSWGRAKFLIVRHWDGVPTRLRIPAPLNEPGPHLLDWAAGGWQFTLSSNDGDEFDWDCYGQADVHIKVTSRCSLHKSEKTELRVFLIAGHGDQMTNPMLHIWCE